MTIPFEEFQSRLLADPEVLAEYKAIGPQFEFAVEFLQARLRAGLSREELAVRIGFSQSAIARIESGQTLPSVKMLLRLAEATGSKLQLRLLAA